MDGHRHEAMTAATELVLDGRYCIEPSAALPDLAPPGTAACGVRDLEESGRPLYAVIPGPGLAARARLLAPLRDAEIPGIVRPVHWGMLPRADGAGGAFTIVMARPAGAPLWPSPAGGVAAWPAARVMADLVLPAITALAELAVQRATHRAIRPTNLFQGTPGQPVVLGDCLSTPPAYGQPALFEPLERMVADATGRGDGILADDLYALGVTMLLLAIGRNPLARLDERAVRQAKLEAGSFAALTGDRRPPGELAPALRGLLADEVESRWSLDDLVAWSGTGRITAVQGAPAASATRPFEFAGVRHRTARTLALAMAENWTEARAVVADDALATWVGRALRDEPRQKALVECRRMARNGPRPVGDDLLLSRTLIVLDPSAPIRVRGCATMPDGLGGALAAALGDEKRIAAFAEIVTGGLLGYWIEQQPRVRTWMYGIQEMGSKFATFLERPSAGFGIERCFYESNPGLPCMSPRLPAPGADTVHALLAALDLAAEANVDEPPVDRHVAAFLAARLPGLVDRELRDMADGANAARALVAEIRLLSYAQTRSGPEAVPALASHYLMRLGPALERLHSRQARDEVRQAAEAAAGRGSLAELIEAVDDSRARRRDDTGFRNARAHWAAAEQEIAALEAMAERRADLARAVGHRAAAWVASVAAAGALAIVVIVQVV
ncbi:MAG: hypothetical protein AB7N54_13475 [Alphaproteobacteria bacterium]